MDSGDVEPMVAQFTRERLISTRTVLNTFGPNRNKLMERFSIYIKEGIGREVSMPISRNEILGSEMFVEQISNGHTVSDDRNHSIETRLANRPKLGELFHGTGDDINERNRAIILARKVCKYKVGEIAMHLNLHITTVSRIINGAKGKDLTP